MRLWSELMSGLSLLLLSRCLKTKQIFANRTFSESTIYTSGNCRSSNIPLWVIYNHLSFTQHKQIYHTARPPWCTEIPLILLFSRKMVKTDANESESENLIDLWREITFVILTSWENSSLTGFLLSGNYQTFTGKVWCFFNPTSENRGLSPFVVGSGKQPCDRGGMTVSRPPFKLPP